jgi:predicted dehydrogenase
MCSCSVSSAIRPGISLPIVRKRVVEPSLMMELPEALAKVHLDYNQCPTIYTLEIVGEEGTIRWDNSDGSAQLFRSSGQTWETYSAPPGFERNELFLAELRHFLETVRGETEPLCTVQDGLSALRLALGALSSAREGRLVRFSKEPDQ